MIIPETNMASIDICKFINEEINIYIASVNLDFDLYSKRQISIRSMQRDRCMHKSIGVRMDRMSMDLEMLLCINRSRD